MPQQPYYGASEEFYRYNAPRRPSERLPDQSAYLQGIHRGSDQTAGAIDRGHNQRAAHTREMYAIAAALPEKLVKNFLDGMRFRQDRVKWQDDLDNTALKRDLDRNTDSRAQAKEGREVLKFEEDQARWPMERDELQGKIDYMDTQRGYVGANTDKVNSERLYEYGTDPAQRGIDKFLMDQLKTRSDISRQGAAAGLDSAQAQKIRAEESWLDKPALVQPPGRENVIPYAPGKAPPALKPKPLTNRDIKPKSEAEANRQERREAREEARAIEEAKYQGGIKIEGAKPKPGFRPTASDAKTAKDAKAAYDKIDGALRQMDQIYARSGTNFVGDDAVAMESLETQILMAQKELDALGVLQGRDELLIKRQVPSPTSFEENLKGMIGQDRYKAKSKQYRDNLERQYDSTLGAAGYDREGPVGKKLTPEIEIKGQGKELPGVKKDIKSLSDAELDKRLEEARKRRRK